MFTTLNIQDDVYNILGTSLVVLGEGDIIGITGKVYKMRRPEQSGYEDVIINTLPISGIDVQRCVVNVNIHVPDVELTIAGKLQVHPNTKRLKELAYLAAKALDLLYKPKYWLWTDSQQVLREEASKEHYINLRIEYRSHKSIQ